MEETLLTNAILEVSEVQNVSSSWLQEINSLFNTHPYAGGCLLFVLYSLCLSLCIPTTLLEIFGINMYGWFAFPFYAAAKYFVVIFVVPFVFSPKFPWGRTLLLWVETAINRFEILQFFELEVNDHPFRTSLLIRFITVPVSIQNYFLRSVSCPLRFNVIALTLASLPMTASHCYAMLTIGDIVESSRDDSGDESYGMTSHILKLVAILGSSAVPGYFVKRYMVYKKKTGAGSNDVEMISTTIATGELETQSQSPRKTVLEVDISPTD